MDQRDELTWIALELTKAGEVKIEEGLLEKTLRAELGVDEEHPIFIPSITFKKNNRNNTIHLLEGYAFVGSGLPEVDYFNLEKTSYVNQVMSGVGSSGIKALSVIENSYIEELRDKLRELMSNHIEVGQKVVLLQGTYSTLEGEVLFLEGSEAIVHIFLRSLKVIIKINKMFLEPIEEEF